MSSKRIGFLVVLLWLVIPGAAFGQIPYWLDVSPGAVYQAPGSPSCFTITVGGSAYMIVDLEFPRLGLIRVDSADQLMIDLRKSMN